VELELKPKIVLKSCFSVPSGRRDGKRYRISTLERRSLYDAYREKKERGIKEKQRF